jgi:hypothetical protein
VIFIVHRAMAEGHGRLSGYMNPQEYWGSLGSVQLVQYYVARLMNALGLKRKECDGFGVFDFTDAVAARAKWQARSPAGGADARAAAVNRPPVDDVAVAEYCGLVHQARAKGALIIAVIPPSLGSVGGGVRPRNDYEARLLRCFEPRDRLVDLNAAEFVRLTQNPASFWDGLHLSDAAADESIEAINRSIEGPLDRRD